MTQPKSQGASQAMLYATGLEEEDMSKPQARVLEGLATVPYAEFNIDVSLSIDCILLVASLPLQT